MTVIVSGTEKEGTGGLGGREEMGNDSWLLVKSSRRDNQRSGMAATAAARSRNWLKAKMAWCKAEALLTGDLRNLPAFVSAAAA